MSMPVTIELASTPKLQENYTVSIHHHRIHTTVTSRPSVVRQWFSKIRHLHRNQLRSGKLLIGLGVQWNPNRTTITPATIQLFVNKHCLIFQLRYSSRSPKVLHSFLSDENVTVVGIWNHMDARLLRESEHRISIRRLVDARHVASDLLGVEKNASMERLAEAVLGVKGLTKDEFVGRSEWDREWLSEEQVEYACVDVFVAFWVGRALKVWEWGVAVED